MPVAGHGGRLALQRHPPRRHAWPNPSDSSLRSVILCKAADTQRWRIRQPSHTASASPTAHMPAAALPGGGGAHRIRRTSSAIILCVSTCNGARRGGTPDQAYQQQPRRSCVAPSLLLSRSQHVRHGSPPARPPRQAESARLCIWLNIWASAAGVRAIMEGSTLPVCLSRLQCVACTRLRQMEGPRPRRSCAVAHLNVAGLRRASPPRCSAPASTARSDAALVQRLPSPLRSAGVAEDRSCCARQRAARLAAMIAGYGHKNVAQRHGTLISAQPPEGGTWRQLGPPDPGQCRAMGAAVTSTIKQHAAVAAWAVLVQPLPRAPSSSPLNGSQAGRSRAHTTESTSGPSLGAAACSLTCMLGC